MLEIRGLTVTYQGNLALAETTLSLAPGRIVGILGPNGAGKSTLLKAILGLVPARGEVHLDGRSLATEARRLAYVPQRSAVDWDFPATVADVVMMGRTRQIGWLAWPKRRDRDLVLEALARVGMSEFARRQIGELSGGQQQRVFLARALAQQADWLLLDEPFVGVDRTTEEILFEIFAGLRAEGRTLLVVNHDLGEAVNAYDDILLLRNQVIAFGPRETTFSAENLAAAYGRPTASLAAIVTGGTGR